MATPEEARRRAEATYNAAADSFDHPANAFWSRYGRRTVERLELQPGSSILDVCCGTGASALPAAERVGPAGRVLAVDLAGDLVELARRKARERGLRNLEFRVADMLDLGLPEARFDAVICVFGIFFVPDMADAVRTLWSLVKRGGRLALTTWGPELFEPMNGSFWSAVRDVRPDLHKAYNPWDRICDARSLRAMLAEAGVADVEVVAETGRHAIAGPEDGWVIALGSGYRGTLEQMRPAQREHVRETTSPPWSGPA